MFDMNGFELYQQLKKNDNHVKVCFLVAVSKLSGYERIRQEG